MAKVLVLKTSMVPAANSFSHALLQAFLAEYRAKRPGDEIAEVDLNETPAAQKTLTAANMKAFFSPEDSDAQIELLKKADKLVVATPMTNFNYPAVLKNWLDHVLVADKTFSYKYKNAAGDAKGLLPHVKAQILATQGAPYGWYPWGDHVKMLEGTLKFMGMQVAPSVLVAGTKVMYRDKTPADAVKDFAEQIKNAAAAF